MAGGARTDLTSPIPDPEDQKILELRKMGLLPQIDTINDNPKKEEEKQEEITMSEMNKEEMEKKLAEVKAAVGEKSSSIPKPVKYVAAAGAGAGLGYVAHKLLHKGGEKAVEEGARLISKGCKILF